MAKNFYLVCCVLCLSLLCGCASTRMPEKRIYEDAIEQINSDKASCLLIVKNEILGWDLGRGLSPLLNLYDQSNNKFKDGIIVDKVIGRAAAFIVVKGEAKKCYGKIMSEDAKKLLEENGITAEYGLLVPKILNRKKDGLCPLEQSVLKIKDDEVDQALVAIRQRLIYLRKHPM